MLIGVEFGDCIGDLVVGAVQYNDVGFIIAPEHFSWKSQPKDLSDVVANNMILIIHEEADLFNTIDALVYDGKILKSTDQSMSVWRTMNYRNNDFSERHNWFEMIIPPEHTTPAEQSAWNHYQMIAGLCSENKT